ncbi:MAG: archease [Candidatus Dadabacteria bacterium]|jgi:SHS2 domain-containing protein|nr:archease [Candidatus Dadabacteria bacterium]
MLDCPVVSYEILDHTADVRIRASGNDLAGLLRGAVLGMAGLIADTNNVECRESVVVEASGETSEELLVHLLGEVLYIHYTRRLVFRDAEVEVPDEGVLRAACTLRGEAYDPARHELGYDIKAVTYHDLKIESAGDGLSAEIVFDV